ncbi:hypothetical protein EVA_05688 [gut metagenome]|uniref:Uncharacterized protein n=1 Tax=gut metagenome TaxID=749906 RepID=J9GTX2_9ZZZZ
MEYIGESRALSRLGFLQECSGCTTYGSTDSNDSSCS